MHTGNGVGIGVVCASPRRAKILMDFLVASYPTTAPCRDRTSVRCSPERALFILSGMIRAHNFTTDSQLSTTGRCSSFSCTVRRPGRVPVLNLECYLLCNPTLRDERKRFKVYRQRQTNCNSRPWHEERSNRGSKLKSQRRRDFLSA